MLSLQEEMAGSEHLCLSADLADSEATQTFADEVLDAFGGLDILVNNVGSIVKLCDFFELTDDDWERSFQINLMPAVRLSRRFIPSLKLSEAPRIINVSSIAAARPGDVFPHYSAMKAALSNLTVSLAQTLAADGIPVNSVSPGPVWSRSWEEEARSTSEQSGKSLDEVREQIRSGTAETVPLQRMGIPEDISGLILFLASNRSGWITATNFTVDGGITRNPY
jgi:NAD(P)-dependent dehydrogenase (short-subunit alcohol dehydrogenase family)